MKKLLMLFLVGCLISPMVFVGQVFAGETIKLAAANTNDTGSYQVAANDDNDNRKGLIFRDAASDKPSKGFTMGAAAVTAGVVVAGLVWAFGQTHSSSSH